MLALAPNQLKVLRLLRSHFKLHKLPPTYTQMGAVFDWEPKQVYATLKALEKKGYITLRPLALTRKEFI